MHVVQTADNFIVFELHFIKKTGIIYKFEEIQRKYIDTSDEMSIIKITKQMWNAFHVFFAQGQYYFFITCGTRSTRMSDFICRVEMKCVTSRKKYIGIPRVYYK